MTEYSMPPCPTADTFWLVGDGADDYGRSWLRVSLMEPRQFWIFRWTRVVDSGYHRWAADPEKNARRAMGLAEKILEDYEARRHNLNGLTGYTPAGER